MKTNKIILDDVPVDANRAKLFWNWLFYINCGFLVLTLLGFLGLWLGLVLMIPLGAINLLSVGILLVKRIHDKMEVKCVIAYFIAAFATLFYGYLAMNDMIEFNHNVQEITLLVAGIFSFVLSGFASYMLNVHRKEI